MTSIRPSGFTFKVDGSKLTSDDLTFILVERSNPSPRKPRLYLLRVLPDGSRRYFSSCYPSGMDNVFRVEYGGIRYTLVLEGKTARIFPCQVDDKKGAENEVLLNNNRTSLPRRKQTTLREGGMK